MGRNSIHILPEHLANKIAAGEVVQRPESVVKELLENALDAGATEITVVVEEAGKKLIRVSDNGTGMSEEDATLALQRHATSKIASAEDLESIRTFGFRGEALPSVAAVSQVTIRTRHRDDPAAVVVTARPGAPTGITHDVREPGTTVTVQNLFFNVPARRKFLKSNATEFRHIYDAVQRMALSYPQAALRFISDGESILDLKPASLEKRVLDLFGEKACEQMIYVHEESELLSVHGFVGKPSFSRRGRTQSSLFLNRRPIYSKALSHAVFSAYEHLTIKNASPVFLLFVGIDPRRVDVNVHPSKMEAKFEDEQAVYGFIHALVRKTLSSSSLIPAVSIHGDREGTAGLRFTDRQHHWPTSSRREEEEFTRIRNQPLTGEERPVRPVNGETLASLLLGGSESPVPVNPESLHSEDGPALAEEAITGPLLQLHNKYIIIQITGGIMIVDQHVAHERVLYEQILRRFEQEEIAGQQLLFPVPLELNAGDAALMQTILPVLAGMGFSVKPFGKNTFLLEAMPPEVSEKEGAVLLEEMLTQYREYQQGGRIEPRDALAKSFSCKAAIKAGDPLTEPEMRSLVRQLLGTRVPFVCPHGRPTVMRISEAELDRRFGRG